MKIPAVLIVLVWLVLIGVTAASCVMQNRDDYIPPPPAPDSGAETETQAPEAGKLSLSPSRGCRVISAPTSADLEDAFFALGKPDMSGLGQALIAAEAETGVNAVLLAGIVALESGWGTSEIARDKNNLAGLGAYDGGEYLHALRFDSRADSIMYLARLIEGKPNGTIGEIGAWYASDPAWPAKVAACMQIINEEVE